MTRPILVATDGRPGSLGAVRLAHLLAERMQRPLSTMSVLEPVPFEGIDPGYPLLTPFPLVEQERAEALREAVLRQLQVVTGTGSAEDVYLESGPPAPSIVRRAMEVDASMIVIGQRRHSTAERWLGADTSLKVVNLAQVPVLVVPPTVDRLPSSALVGVDFSEFSTDAARTALDVLAGEATLHLVHVTWTAPGQGWEEDLQWARTYNAGAAARLEELRDRLQEFRAFTGETHLATGDPAAEILGEATRLGVDLIAVGSHGYGFLGRLVSGSVSTRLLRRAACPLLIAPPREATEEVLSAGAATSAARGSSA